MSDSSAERGADATLAWSPWVPFVGGDFRSLPRGPGLYRVRLIGAEHMAYIGQTGRDLRQRLASLRLNTLATDMPFNDPHTAGPSLWVWRNAEGQEFECSAAEYSLDARTRMAMESWLLWRHRIELGVSTTCNYGRFHPDHSKSGDRRSGRRGSQLPEGQINSAGVGSSTPLQLRGDPRGADWMGLEWSDWFELPAAGIEAVPALYRIAGDGSGLLYVGETLNLRARLLSHVTRDWGTAVPRVSFARVERGAAKHQLHELENDLIAAHFEQVGVPPAFQFGNGRDVS